jgi:hypothetical protein
VTGAAVALAVAPSAAADDPATFDLKYGATYFTGTINFYNRSVRVDGYLRSLSTSCRRGTASSWNSNATEVLDVRSTSAHCDGVTEQHLVLGAPVAGGAGWVEVTLANADGGDLVWCWAQRGDKVCN